MNRRAFLNACRGALLGAAIAFPRVSLALQDGDGWESDEIDPVDAIWEEYIARVNDATEELLRTGLAWQEQYFGRLESDYKDALNDIAVSVARSMLDAE